VELTLGVMMNLKIINKEYSLEQNPSTILEALKDIKSTQNQELTFRSGCKSGVCGSCAVVVNGIEKLACTTKCQNGDKIEPLKNAKVIKDLVVDMNYEEKFLKNATGYLKEYKENTILPEDEKVIDVESNCILCHSCYSSCPIYEVNSEFLGPFALTRAFRYINDKKEDDVKIHIDSIQTNGVWDCTLCGACSLVCPSMIDIKNDIIKLRNKSVQYGYMDPAFSNYDSSFDASSPDFGFNPNF
jgi:succinate dehydrogenase/fumarate reductase iron-sulfur protein